MKVKMLANFMGFVAGQVVDVDDATALALVESGAGEALEVAPVVAPAVEAPAQPVKPAKRK